MQSQPDSNLVKYQILLQHRQFLDRLFWSRVQTFHAIQAAVLAGSFAVRDKGWYDEGLLALGATLAIALLFICRNDWADAECNKQALYSLGEYLGIRRGSKRGCEWFNEWRKTWKSQKSIWTKARGVLFIEWFRPRGHVIFYIIILTFVGLDLSLFFIF